MGPHFLIGKASSEHLLVEVIGRNHPSAQDYWDGNWVRALLSVHAGGFRGNCEASLRTEELARFRTALGTLYDTLSGAAEFATMEKWLELQVVSDRLGHLSVEGQVRDQPGIGNTLTFRLEIDQTQIPPTLRGLDGILTAFPVIGSPGRS